MEKLGHLNMNDTLEYIKELYLIFLGIIMELCGIIS